MGFDPQLVDRLKRQFYDRLDTLQQRAQPGYYSEQARSLTAEIFPVVPSAGQIKDVKAYAEGFVDEHGAKLDLLIERFGKEINLEAGTRDLDHLLASLDPANWPPDARREVLINYLGFPFWDVLTLPMTSTRETGEMREILIDRISPRDAGASEAFAGADSLKGVGFGHFAAFLSRSYRENDYLMGRLHALDRLIDIVCDSAGLDPMKPELLALKKRGFSRILNSEEKNLSESSRLIASLRQRIGEIGDSVIRP